ncbi:hypothetical protein [Roseibium suaedae]|uniref:Aldolase n=1 Tax=Roseibium suaedae TaxID=735517 RepID=A0A1M7MX07_9HYPH|nr:hypothetical protein [Roseibium suaedae]SHM95705.1 hypothetical protein SAMN05444272_3597 [Roseibium suaedae]
MMPTAFQSSGDMRQIVLWHWTDDLEEAAACSIAGVNRIGIDIDRLGKAERQAGQNSWISRHQIEVLPLLRERLPGQCLFLRTNGLHDGSIAEVETALAGGVDILMFPNFQTIRELETFLKLVDCRAKVVPLVERHLALPLISAFPTLGIDEFHFGLNDLSLDMRVPNRLSLFLHPEIEAACECARRAGLNFGIGGVARPGQDSLPVDPYSVIAQHARLGSTGAMLARSFWFEGRQKLLNSLGDEIACLRKAFRLGTQLPSGAARGLLEQQLELAQ